MVKNKAPFSTTSPPAPGAIFAKQDKPNGFTQRALKSCSHKGYVEGEAENSGFTSSYWALHGFCENMF